MEPLFFSACTKSALHTQRAWASLIHPLLFSLAILQGMGMLSPLMTISNCCQWRKTTITGLAVAFEDQ